MNKRIKNNQVQDQIIVSYVNNTPKCISKKVYLVWFYPLQILDKLLKLKKPLADIKIE